MSSVDIGALLGRYKIESVLGKGGMSVVYRATDPKLQRTVAVKVMHDYLSQNQDISPHLYCINMLLPRVRMLCLFFRRLALLL